MCLIAFALDPTPGLRLVLAANRDEFHARPSAALARWTDPPDLIAGRDVQASGIWLGLSTRGRLAAVTNVRLPDPPPTGRLSRGALALDFLEREDSPAQHLAHLHGSLDDYGPCNLLMVEGREAIYASNQAGVPPQALASGVYGLSNAALDTPWPKTVALKAALTRWLDAGVVNDPEPLFAALANPTTPPDAALPDTGVGIDRERFVAPAFIVGEQYGTRCSTVVIVDAEGQGRVIERRFGAGGVALGESVEVFAWPAAQ